MKSRQQTSIALLLLCLSVFFALSAWPNERAHAQGNVQVNAADPAAAAQGTVNLNVKVTGKGFKNGAHAPWSVTGTTFIPSAPIDSQPLSALAFDSFESMTAKTFALTVRTPQTCNPVSFAPAVNIGVGTRPTQVVVGDFNSDGKQDLAVSEQDDVSIFLGSGTGDFIPGTQITPGGSPAVGDFNGDGKQDLAISRTGNGTSDIAIYAGDGSGNFSLISIVDIGCIFSFWPLGVRRPGAALLQREFRIHRALDSTYRCNKATPGRRTPRSTPKLAALSGVLCGKVKPQSETFRES